MKRKKANYRSNVFRHSGVELGVDRNSSTIKGVVAIQAGQVNDCRPYVVTQQTLEQVRDLGNTSNKGMKVRFTHPGMCEDGLGKHLGRAKNFRLDGDFVRADIHIASTAKDTPNGNLAEYVMSLAEEDPEAFGMSIVCELGEEIAGDECDEECQDESGDNDSLTEMNVVNLYAVDFVDEPAATRTGLFNSLDKPDLPTSANWLIDTFFQGKEPSVIEEAFRKLMKNRYGTSMSSEIDSVELQQEDETLQEQDIDNPADESVDSDEPAASESSLAEEMGLGQKLLDRFGEKGAVWFIEGKSFAEAMDLHCKDLEEALLSRDKLIEQLQTQLKASLACAGAEDEPLSASDAGVKPSELQQKAAKYEKHGKTVSSLAALIESGSK